MGEGVTTLGMRTNFDALTRHIRTGAAYSLTEAEAGAVSFFKGLIRTVRVTPRALAPAEFLQPPLAPAGASL